MSATRFRSSAARIEIRSSAPPHTYEYESAVCTHTSSRPLRAAPHRLPAHRVSRRCDAHVYCLPLLALRSSGGRRRRRRSLIRRADRYSIRSRTASLLLCAVAPHVLKCTLVRLGEDHIGSISPLTAKASASGTRERRLVGTDVISILRESCASTRVPITPPIIIFVWMNYARIFLEICNCTHSFTRSIS